MRILSRTTVLAAVPLVAACCLTLPARAGAAPASGREPVGGAQLGSRGVIVNIGPGVPALPKLRTSAFLIADGDTGEVLAAKDPHGHYLPASTLKTLTAVSLIPRLNRDALVRPTQHTCDVEGTKVGMTPKLQYRVQDLFRALIMVSGNDAALALTQAAGGLKPAIAAMNAEARRLHANDTLAASPNGLDVDLGLNVRTQHTSAYDLALILRQGLKLPDFRGYIGTVDASFPAPPTKKERKKGKTVGSYPIYTHDRLLRPGSSRYPGMIGGKNGYTAQARQTFVGAARRNGHTIIVSLMHSPYLWPYAAKLFNWGFAAVGKARPVGTLVSPGWNEKAGSALAQQRGAKSGKGAGHRPASSGGWVLPAAGAGAAAVLGAGLAIAVRRRRTAPTSGSPPGMVDVPVRRDPGGHVYEVTRPPMGEQPSDEP